MRSTPSASYAQDPTSVLNSSIAVPVRWNSTMTQSSRPLSRRNTNMPIWIRIAAMVRASLRASAASSGYHKRAATITARSRAPNTHAQACLRRKTQTSISAARGPCAGRPASTRLAARSITRSSGVNALPPAPFTMPRPYPRQAGCSLTPSPRRDRAAPLGAAPTQRGSEAAPIRPHLARAEPDPGRPQPGPHPVHAAIDQGRARPGPHPTLICRTACCKRWSCREGDVARRERDAARRGRGSPAPCPHPLPAARCWRSALPAPHREHTRLPRPQQFRAKTGRVRQSGTPSARAYALAEG